jgi:hypothetical protein
MSFCSDRVAIFGEKNYSAEDGTYKKFDLYRLKSVYFAEQKRSEFRSEPFCRRQKSPEFRSKPFCRRQNHLELLNFDPNHSAEE